MTPDLRLVPWGTVSARGCRLLAQFDDARVVVYRAGGSDRAIELHPTFTSLMAATSWGTAPGRERTLALHLRRDVFDALLRQAVPGDFCEAYACKQAWRLATRFALVVARWGELPGPNGPTGARAPWLTIRDAALWDDVSGGVVRAEDLTSWVEGCRARLGPELALPDERPYPLAPSWLPPEEP